MAFSLGRLVLQADDIPGCRSDNYLFHYFFTFLWCSDVGLRVFLIVYLLPTRIFQEEKLLKAELEKHGPTTVAPEDFKDYSVII